MTDKRGVADGCDLRQAELRGGSPAATGQGFSIGVVQGLSTPRKGCGKPGRVVHAPLWGVGYSVVNPVGKAGRFRQSVSGFRCPARPDLLRSCMLGLQPYTDPGNRVFSNVPDHVSTLSGPLVTVT